MSVKQLPYLDQLPLSLGKQAIADSLSITFATGDTLPIDLGDTNWGAVGADTLRTAAQIGNATGAADFGSGATSAQTVRVILATDQPALPLSTDAATETTLSSVVSELSALNSSWNADYGASTDALRVAAQIGNASGAAAFGAGTTSAQTLRVVLPTDQSAIPASQSGTWNINNISGTISLPTGAATEVTSGLINSGIISSNLLLTSIYGTASSIDSKLSADFGVSSAAVRVAALLGNASGAAAWGAGVVGSSTLRVVHASDASINTLDKGYTTTELLGHDYSSVNVTTGVYQEIIASTSVAYEELDIFDSSGSVLVLATGAAASEVNRIYIQPGGNGRIRYHIPAGTRLSIKAVDTNATTGQLRVTAFAL